MDGRENDKSLQSNCPSVRWRKGKRDSAMEEGILSSHGVNSNLNWMVFDLPNRIDGYRGFRVDIGGLSRNKSRNGMDMARKATGMLGKSNRGLGKWAGLSRYRGIKPDKPC